MYIFKNANRNVVRGRGRSILVGLIIMVVTIAASIALGIHQSGNQLITSYQKNNPISVSFRMNMEEFRANKEITIESLTKEEIQKYGDSKYVKDYYYTGEVSLSANIEAVVYANTTEANIEKKNDRENKSMGDFRLTGYSNPAYIENFISGTNQMKEGQMFSGDSTDAVVVISEELAKQNNLTVGDTISFYMTTNTEQTYSFTIIGIYEDNTELEGNNTMGIALMNSANQMYTNITQIEMLLEKFKSKMNTLIPTYYLYQNSDLDAFKEEINAKGLSSQYQIKTNEEEVLSSLDPISNISKFSITFLIIILIVGSIILSVINLIQIRERKYEIGVLRAIGMSKWKVTIQLVIEVIIVAMISFIIGTGIGMMLSQPVTNTLLKNEIESYSKMQEQMKENFGGEGFERPGFGENHSNQVLSSNQEYVSTLKVTMDFKIILKLFMISLILVGVSSMISVLFVNQYEPNKILQNRS